MKVIVEPCCLIVYRSFFSAKPGKCSPRTEAKAASHLSTPEKTALIDLNSDSPVFKRRAGKKRLVLTDSDSENDESEEVKLLVPEETPASKAEKIESGKKESSSAQLEMMLSPKKPPASSLIITSPLKTPPKRSTGETSPFISWLQLPGNYMYKKCIPSSKLFHISSLFKQ